MYKLIKIENYKCFEHLELNNLGKINLLAGKNNIGKTSFLEALFIHCGAYNPLLGLKILSFRGLSDIELAVGWWAEKPWDTLFNMYDINNTIKIYGRDNKRGPRSLLLSVETDSVDNIPNNIGKRSTANINDTQSTYEKNQVLVLTYKEANKTKKRHTLRIDATGINVYPPNPEPPFPGFYIRSSSKLVGKEIIGRYSTLQKSSSDTLLLETLKIVEPTLEKIEISDTAGMTLLHGKCKNSKLMPLQYMGEGIIRLTDFLIHIANAKNGVVLIDEIENGFHHSVQTKVWQAIFETAKMFNVQIFATTHSRECIANANNALKYARSTDFRLLRLEKQKGAIRSVTYNVNKLQAAIDLELEIR